MSKLLKRTFAFALVFCMLLSVIPAISVSAAFPAEDAVVYNFAAAYNNGSAITDPLNVTKALYEAGTLYEDADSQTPLNWYALGVSREASNDMEFSNNGIYTNRGVWDWFAVVIEVPATGNYDVIAAITASGNGVSCGVLTLTEIASNPAVESVASTGKNKFHGGTYTNALASSIDFTLRNTGGGAVGYAYLGNITLNKGFYVLGLQKDSGDTVSSNQMTLNKFTLTPNSKTSFADAINAYSSNSDNYDDRYTGRTVYQLVANLDAENSDIVLANQTIDLRGYSMKVNSVSSITEGVWSTSNDYFITSYIRGIRGEGTVTASSMELSSNSVLQGQIPVAVKDKTNTYMFYDAPTATVYTEAKDAIDIADAATAAKAKALGFKVELPETAVAAFTDCDFSNVKIELTMVVESTGATAYCDYTSDNAAEGGKVTDWASGSGAKAFYVNIANYDLLAGENLQMQVKISANGYEYTATGTHTVPAA